MQTQEGKKMYKQNHIRTDGSDERQLLFGQQNSWKIGQIWPEMLSSAVRVCVCVCVIRVITISPPPRARVMRRIPTPIVFIHSVFYHCLTQSARIHAELWAANGSRDERCARSAHKEKSQ